MNASKNRSLKRGMLAAAVAVLILHIAAATSASAGYKARDGDIIFHRSCSCQSNAIAAATSSRYTHVGIIFIENGREMVYEACSTVRATPLAKFIKTGKDSHYVIKRLKNTDKLNTKSLKSEVRKMRGRRYDKYFDWSDSKIYCSELVWKAYQRGCRIELGKLRQMKDFNLKKDVVKKTLQSRYGSRVPLEMKVIAPSDIYSSRLLKTVDSGGGAVSQFARKLGRYFVR